MIRVSASALSCVLHHAPPVPSACRTSFCLICGIVRTADRIVASTVPRKRARRNDEPRRAGRSRGGGSGAGRTRRARTETTRPDADDPTAAAVADGRGAWWRPRARCWRAAGSRRSPWRPWRPRRAPTATRCATTSAARRRFVAAVVDSLAHDQSLAAVAETLARRPGRSACARSSPATAQLVDDRDVVPRLLRHLPARACSTPSCARGSRGSTSGTATSTLRLWAARRRPRRRALRGLASLMVAMTDGLAVQKLLDPDGVRARVCSSACGRRSCGASSPVRGGLTSGSFTAPEAWCTLAARVRRRMGGSAGRTGQRAVFRRRMSLWRRGP